MDRRTLFKSVAAAGVVGVGAARGAQPQAASAAVPGLADPEGPLPPLPRLTDAGELRGEMLYRKLGRTGERVSAIGFGGSHFAKPGIEEATSLRLCHAAVDCGITFMDNAWDYNKAIIYLANHGGPG